MIIFNHKHEEVTDDLYWTKHRNDSMFDLVQLVRAGCCSIHKYSDSSPSKWMPHGIVCSVRYLHTTIVIITIFCLCSQSSVTRFQWLYLFKCYIRYFVILTRCLLSSNAFTKMILYVIINGYEKCFIWEKYSSELMVPSLVYLLTTDRI